MSKSKKTLETSLDLTPSFSTSVDTRVEGLVSNKGYLQNQRYNFILKNMAEKDVCRAFMFRSLDCNFSVSTDLPLSNVNNVNKDY